MEDIRWLALTVFLERCFGYDKRHEEQQHEEQHEVVHHDGYLREATSLATSELTLSRGVKY